MTTNLNLENIDPDLNYYEFDNLNKASQYLTVQNFNDLCRNYPSYLTIFTTISEVLIQIHIKHFQFLSLTKYIPK